MSSSKAMALSYEGDSIRGSLVNLMFVLSLSVSRTRVIFLAAVVLNDMVVLVVSLVTVGYGWWSVGRVLDSGVGWVSGLMRVPCNRRKN